MQKQLNSNIKYFQVLLDDEFPVCHFRYTLKSKEHVKLHYHNSFEIGICISGNGLFFIDNKVCSFKKNDVSFIFPNQPHIAQSPNEVSSDWFFISVDFNQLFIDNKNISSLFLLKYQIPNLISSSIDSDISSIILMLITELDEKNKSYKQAIRSLFMFLILKIIRLQTEDNTLDDTLFNSFNLISPSLNYISAFYSEEITVAKIAQMCNLSETYFRVVFKKVTNYSPLQYIAYIRMKMAKGLLKATNMPILIIAQNVGYLSISSFNRCFKTSFGISPSEYRKLGK